MNDDSAARAAARDRLFQAELSEVLDACRAGPAEVRRPPWLAVAVVLLGVVVAFGVAWQRVVRDAAQEPHRLDPPDLPTGVTAQTVADLAGIDHHTTCLMLCCRSSGEEYVHLAPFTALRRLTIMAPAVAVPPPARSLAPIAAMPHLVQLWLPLQPGTSADDMRSLAAAPQLQFLELQCHRALRLEDVQALAAWPRLRSLTLKGGRLDATLLRSLAQLGRLEALTISHVQGCTEEVLRELRGLHGLRRIHLHSLGELPMATRLGSPGAGGVGLSVPVAKALAELPLLEDVEIVTCAVTAAAIESLPERLVGFHLSSCPDADANVVAALQRFRSLQRLGLDRFDPGRWSGTRAMNNPTEAPTDRQEVAEEMPDQPAIWRAQAQLLQHLPVRRLYYEGPLPEELKRPLATAPALQRCEILWGNVGDAAAAVANPHLRHLRLNTWQGSLDDLRPLATHGELRRLDLLWARPAATAVRRLLPRITVWSNMEQP